MNSASLSTTRFKKLSTDACPHCLEQRWEFLVDELAKLSSLTTALNKANALPPSCQGQKEYVHRSKIPLVDPNRL
jgi:hypothetical protein